MFANFNKRRKKNQKKINKIPTPTQRSSGTEKSSKAKVATEDPAATLINHLHANGIFQTALRLFKLAEEIRFRSYRMPASELPVGLFDAALETLGTKVLGSKTIDHSLAFAYMVALPMQKSFVAFKVRLLPSSHALAKNQCQLSHSLLSLSLFLSFQNGLSTVGNNFHRLVQFAGIGMSCALLWKQSSFLVDCKKLKKNAVWWHHLSLLGLLLLLPFFSLFSPCLINKQTNIPRNRL